MMVLEENLQEAEAAEETEAVVPQSPKHSAKATTIKAFSYVKITQSN